MVSCEKTFLGAYDFAVLESAIDGPGLRRVYPGARPADDATAEQSERVAYWRVGDHEAVEAGRSHRADDIFLRIEPAGSAAWTGIFEALLQSSGGAHGVVALPDRRSLAVASHGTVYRVRADTPEDWEEIMAGVQSDPLVIEPLELVLILDFTSVIAYGDDGRAWETEQLVWDDLRSVGVDNHTLHVEGFDAPLNEIVPFTIDLRTGTSPNAPHPNRRMRRPDGPM